MMMKKSAFLIAVCLCLLCGCGGGGGGDGDPGCSLYAGQWQLDIYNLGNWSHAWRTTDVDCTGAFGANIDTAVVDGQIDGSGVVSGAIYLGSEVWVYLDGDCASQSFCSGSYDAMSWTMTRK